MPIIKKTVKRPWMPEKEVQTGRKHSNTKFYQSMPWRRLRKSYIDSHPLCVECEKNGRTVPAKIVDHITPINQGGAALATNNLQSLCSICHNRKSASESRYK